MGGKEKDGKAGSVALFNHSDTTRSDAEKIQSWCRLVRAAAAEKFSIFLVSVLFTENIDVSDGFWGLTKNSAFKLWFENNVELYKPIGAPKVPKRKSGETDDDWKQRMAVYRAKLTNWSAKTEEANQKYRQMQNKAYVSFAEGQAWLYNHCAASFESSDKATLKRMSQQLLLLNCRRRTVPLLSMICASYWLHLERFAIVNSCRRIEMWGTRMRSSSRLSGIALSTPTESL